MLTIKDLVFFVSALVRVKTDKKVAWTMDDQISLKKSQMWMPANKTSPFGHLDVSVTLF